MRRRATAWRTYSWRPGTLRGRCVTALAAGQRVSSGSGERAVHAVSMSQQAPAEVVSAKRKRRLQRRYTAPWQCFTR